MNHTADVAIIGGGIVGCATAYYLAKRGIKAAVYEKGEINGEQSSRAWGFVRQQGRDPAEMPLMVESNRLWQTLEQELNADLGWRQEGVLYLAYTEERIDQFEGWIDVARQYQLQTRIVSKREVEQMLPGIHTDCVGAMLTPNDGHAEPELVAHAYHRAAQTLGAKFYPGCAVTAIERSGDRITGLVTEQGTVRVDNVVCAAGVWSRALLKSIGIKIPQIWMRGSVARTTPVRPISGLAIWSKVAFRQHRDGRLNIASGIGSDHDLVPSDLPQGWSFLPNFWKYKNRTSLHLGKPFVEELSGGLTPTRYRTLDPAPNSKRIDEALTTLKQTFPDLQDVAVEKTWAGYIDMTPDMVPIIDALSRPAGLVIATGMSGHGFGFGPVVGRVVAELIDTGRSSFDLGEFRLDRFNGFKPRAPRAVV